MQWIYKIVRNINFVFNDKIAAVKTAYQFSYFSEKLSELLKTMNQRSINLYAEHLMNQIGVFKYRSGDVGSGTQATTLFWKEKELDINGFYLWILQCLIG